MGYQRIVIERRNRLPITCEIISKTTKNRYITTDRCRAQSPAFTRRPNGVVDDGGVFIRQMGGVSISTRGRRWDGSGIGLLHLIQALLKARMPSLVRLPP
ncbi:hypothetical protein CWO89_42910 [Bradyrhizobium sp. Leo170]|nr:hypothetical protein CWO90_45925 [Bradyrhizobium sp. Leo121]TAI60040.1 hypothetical protein CWO89_42910 [Bradyrhizobium sp. Leo170]